ncbi:hypothetical protein M728_005679 (plasmid) [Ensifer sp. WSM1721]
MSVTRSAIRLSSGCNGDSSFSVPRLQAADFGHPTQRTRRQPISSEKLKRLLSTIYQTYVCSNAQPSTQAYSTLVDFRTAPRAIGRPRPQGSPEVHQSILAAYVWPDPVTGTSLAQMASTLPQVDIVNHLLLRPGRPAQIVIGDCRDLTQNTHGRAKFAFELVHLALVAENSRDRRMGFSNGYSDYLLWRPIEQVLRSGGAAGQSASRAANCA